MRRYFSMYWAFFKNCLVREMEFKSNFILYSLINLIWAVLALLTFVFIYDHVTEIDGWTLPQLLLLTATYYFFDRIFDAFFEINFFNFNNLVNRGELDFILIKPVSGQFLVSLRYFSFSSLIGAVSMGILIIYLIVKFFWPVGLVNLCLYGLIILLAEVIVYALWFSTLTLVFWWGNIDNIHHFFRPVYELVRIPIDITGPLLRPFLTLIIPLAFVATVPVQVITQPINIWLIMYGVFAAGFFLWLSHRWWHFALRHYTSASS